MTFKEFVKQINPSPMAYNAYQGYWFLYGTLPDIPKGFFLCNANYDITSDELAKAVLDILKPENKLIDKLQEGTEEYERHCFFVALQFSEVVDFWCGKHEVKENKLGLIDCIGFDMWDYLKGKMSFKRLKKETIETYKKYLEDEENK